MRQKQKIEILNDRFAEDTTQYLKDKVELLDAEKEMLVSRLDRFQKRFDEDLEEGIKKAKEQRGNSSIAQRKQKSPIHNFAEQVMDEGEAPMWIITYSDMATLLLTFFILYYSIAAMNLGKFKDAILGDTESSQSMIELIESTKINKSLQEISGIKPNNLLKTIKYIVTDNDEIGISKDKSKIVVRIPGRTLFQPASADLQKEGWPLLEKVVGVFIKFPGYNIHIQGHTDDDPITTGRFPSNWELSATRATAVLRFFVDKGLDPKRLTATGYADTFPLNSNITKLGRASNRRVEFVLEKIK